MKNNYRNRFYMIFLLCHVTFGLQAASEVKLGNQFPIREIRQYIDDSDTNQLAHALLDLNENYNRYHGQELLDLLQEAENHSEQTDLYCLFGFYSLIRKYYEEDGNSSKAMEYALKCYNLLKNEPESAQLYWLMVDIGNIFYDIRDYNQAQGFYEKSIGIANRLKDAYGMSVIYLNLGLVADQKKEYTLALKYYKLSASYRLVSGNVKFVSSAYTNIANTYFKMNKPDSALYYTDQAKYYYESGNVETDLLIEVPAAYNLGYYKYYAFVRKFQKAEPYLHKARDYSMKNNLTGSYIASFFAEASCLVKDEQFEKAISVLNEILPFIKQKGLLMNEKDLYKSLAECHAKRNQFEQATIYFRKYLVLEDSLENISLNTEFNNIRAITEVHESEVKLQQMKRNLEVGRLSNEMERKRKKISYNIAALSFSGFLVLAFLFLQFVQRGKKVEKLQASLKEQNNKIKIKSNELLKSNQVKDKIFSVIAHDLRNPLNRLLVEVALIKQEIPPNKSGIIVAMENTLKETIDLFERLLQWSKRDNKQIIYSPSVFNLSESINKIITFYLSEIKYKNISVVNSCSTLNAFVDTNVLLTLLRNILGNAIKAVGSGGTIEVQCEKLDEKLIQVTFSDSGSGFSQEILDDFNDEGKEENIGEGTGLMLCKVLAKYNGWPISLSNDSEYGGAKITLTIPAYRKKISQEKDDVSQLEHIQMTDEAREKLLPVKKFKIYQTSELRQFLHAVETKDPNARKWVVNTLEAIHEGNASVFQKLLEML